MTTQTPRETWTVTGPQILDLAEVVRLDATIMNGRIDVVAHEDPAERGARIEVHDVDGRPLEIRLDGGTLRVGYTFDGTGWKNFLDRFRTYSGKDSVDVYVAVPADADVRVATVRGDGLVAGARQGARVATVAGTLMVADSTGALAVDTVSGEVTVSDHEGSLTMESVSGDLTATGALTDVRLDTVSGAVTIDTRSTPDALSVNAVSADVLVRLPDPDAMSYTARCVSGRLLIDGVEYRTAAGSFKRPGPGALSGGDGDPARPVSVTAVSGNVTILRGAPVRPAEPAVSGDVASSWGSPGGADDHRVRGDVEDR
ncbi:DUF4097 family beta strand repeat-containing protein [Oerskovia flava]|uniref:DUF4097 family beta strand repeat-containing protein n=1 Tax=Oerskovia flava TaxID=2986422 RepID=UPI00223F4D28|nr:DUF4097 family beta strand repeat-containing protein [Oerskovia sp. JB1-3-2]